MGQVQTVVAVGRSPPDQVVFDAEHLPDSEAGVDDLFAGLVVVAGMYPVAALLKPARSGAGDLLEQGGVLLPGDV
jgi:hypothetical protein